MVRFMVLLGAVGVVLLIRGAGSDNWGANNGNWLEIEEINMANGE